MQTSYSQYMDNAYPGLIADVQFQNNVVSKSLESASLNPGLAVARGTDADRQVVKAGADPIGICVRSLDTENNASNELEYVAGDTVGIMTAGSIWVELGNTGSPGDAIYSIDATGVIQAGTAATGQTQLNGTLETEVTSAGALAIVKLTEQGN